jgi:SulP family sulfate permease
MNTKDILQNVLAGLTVSFVAISLGAAFGIASGRPDGAFVGILSAGVIALITAIFGGTRIQCSGPTAPMTAVTATIVLAATAGPLAAELAEMGVDSQHFINQVFILTGAMLILMAIFRLGRFITVVPKVVISGFMNGIALLIWIGEVSKLLGLGDYTQTGGQMSTNVALALVTVFLCFTLPKFIKGYLPSFLHFIPGALIAIIVVSAGAAVLGLTDAQAEFTKLASVKSIADMASRFTGQLPMDWSIGVLALALPFAFNLTMLCYLDTLLTSLVVDKMATRLFGKPEVTKQNKELAAQGVANAFIALFGGIPGAQATIRSVLILNEKATVRLAGIMVGIFVVLEMLIFQGWLQLIPKAVFAGILLKVGWDVMDWEPMVIYFRRRLNMILKPIKGMPSDISHVEMFFIIGTTLVTVLINLNVAVISFCVLFYIVRTRLKIHDLDQNPFEEDEEAIAAST